MDKSMQDNLTHINITMQERALSIELAHLFIDFYNMDTVTFVARYGLNVSTRTLGDKARTFLKMIGEQPHDTGRY